MSGLFAAGVSDVGCFRTNNEDRIRLETSHGVFILSDGMGGERCGEVAAQIAVDTAGDFLLSPHSASDPATWPFEYDFSLDGEQNRIMNGVRLANRRIWESTRTRQDCDGMGATISALVCKGSIATIGNIGDSRVYVFRQAQLRLLTRDDAVVANMIEAGEITVEEARLHPLRNVLTSALGTNEDVAVQLVQFALKTGDRLLLSSDGLHGLLEHAQIAQLLGECPETSSAAFYLTEAAREAGGFDNISCIVVDFSASQAD